MAAGVLEQRRGQTAATRVAGDDQPLGLHATVEESFEDADRVLEPGGEGELGREPVVGDEQLAAGAGDQLGRDDRVHRRRRREVAAAVQVEDRPGRSAVRPDPQTGDVTDGAGLHRGGVGPEPGEHHAAEVVEQLLHRSQLGRRQPQGPTEEGADDLARALLRDVRPHVARPAPGTVQAEGADREAEAGGQRPDGAGRPEHARGGDVGPVRHHHRRPRRCTHPGG